MPTGLLSLNGIVQILLGIKLFRSGCSGIKSAPGPQLWEPSRNPSPPEKMESNQQTISIGWGAALIALGILNLSVGLLRLFHGKY
jgi:hypothetical protein